MLNDLRGLKLLQQFSLCSWLNVFLQFVFVAVKLLGKTICSLENISDLDGTAMKILLLKFVLSDQKLFVSVAILDQSWSCPIIHSARKVHKATFSSFSSCQTIVVPCLAFFPFINSAVKS